MEAPASIRLERSGRDTASYRDAPDEPRRIVWIRARTPRRPAMWVAASLAMFGVGAVLLTTHGAELAHGPMTIAFATGYFTSILGAGLSVTLVPAFVALIVWRRLRWVRLELDRTQLVADQGPFGTRVVVPSWAARAVGSTVRPSRWGTAFTTWDLFAERADGQRECFATLHEADTAEHVVQLLRKHYDDDATPSDPRHPFAVRFGPMPEGVTCQGDPEDEAGRWVLEASCPRRGRVADLCVVLLAGVACLGSTYASIGLLYSVACLSVSPVLLFPAVALTGLSAGLYVAARFSLRDLLLHSTGRVRLVAHGTTVILETILFGTLCLSRSVLEAPVQMETLTTRGDDAVARVRGREARGGQVAPLRIEDARYLATVLEAHRAGAARR